MRNVPEGGGLSAKGGGRGAKLRRTARTEPTVGCLEVDEVRLDRLHKTIGDGFGHMQPVPARGSMRRGTCDG